ncbi:MAG: hypothetical protein ACOCQ5_00325 [Halanaerobiales bacterium]
MNIYKFKIFSLVIIWTLILGFTTFPVIAHDIHIQVHLDGDLITVEGHFEKDSPVENGEVKVYDDKGNLIEEGTTDENGIYEFEVDTRTDMDIVLEDDLGHHTEYELKENELPEITEESGDGEEKNSHTSSTENNLVNMEEDVLRSIISKEMDSKVDPINHQLQQIQKEQQGQGFIEIFGGIGYIFGIMGIALYIKGRK